MTALPSPSRTLFLGSKALGLRALRVVHAVAPELLVGAVTIDDSSDVRSALASFQAFAADTGVPLYVARNRQHADDLVRELTPDRCFVLGWYWLIGETVLAAVPEGFIGIHFSRLPAYRGTSPLVWQMINGATEAWYSVFTLTTGMDEGAIWARGSVPIAGEDDVADVLARLEEPVMEALAIVYRGILRGDTRPHPQETDGATYCAARLPEDGLIDFTRPARACHDFIRAQAAPYPGAFTFYLGEPLIVWKAAAIDVTYYGRAGQVARVDDAGVTVICGDQRPILLQTVGWRGETLPARAIVKSVRTRLPSARPPGG